MANPLRKLIDHVLHLAESGFGDGNDPIDLDALEEVTIRRDLVGVASWTTPNPTGRGARHSHSATAGEVVTMPNRAALRLAVLGCIEGINPGELVDAVKASGKHVDPAVLRDIARPRSRAAQAARAVDPVEANRESDAEAAATPTADPTVPPAEEVAPEVAPLGLGVEPDGTGPGEPGASLADFVEPAGDGTGDPVLEDPRSELEDAELADMAAGDLTAHLTQFPGDAQRVRALELARPASRQRSTVLEATGLTADEVAELTGAE